MHPGLDKTTPLPAPDLITFDPTSAIREAHISGKARRESLAKKGYRCLDAGFRRARATNSKSGGCYEQGSVGLLKSTAAGSVTRKGMPKTPGESGRFVHLNAWYRVEDPRRVYDNTGHRLRLGRERHPRCAQCIEVVHTARRFV